MKHRIILLLTCVALGCILLMGCENTNRSETTQESSQSIVWESENGSTDIQKEGVSEDARLEYDHSLELLYANQFRVDYYKGDYALISTSEGSRYLVIPENEPVPEALLEDIVVIQQPVEHVYLAATAVMGLFDALDALDAIYLSSQQADNWYVENAKIAMQEGRIVFAGKYSEPDYELLLSSHCPLAIESTMIYHTPEVKEKLEELGIDVIVDRSSYESHPLGRTEWMKLYSVLVDKEEEAEVLFQKQVEQMNLASGEEPTGKTVAFFSLSAGGYAIARKSGDYVTKMIELAGGSYIFDNLGDTENATATVSLEMEQFYATAKDADIIIYNGSMDGGVYSLDELISKNELLKEFKAVKEGNVWTTGKNLFQENTQLGEVIAQMHEIFTGEATELEFFQKLE